MKRTIRSITRLRHILAVARHGSYSRAAIELHISQSALSRSIQAIESDLDVQLFTRVHTGVRPTAAGATLIRKARHLLDSADDLETTMARISGRSNDEVRFGIGPLPASVALTALFTEVLQSTASPALSAHVGTGMVLRDMLEEGTVEFFICASGAVSSRSGLRQLPIVSLPIAPRVRRDHPLTRIAKITSQDVLAYPMVGGNLSPDLSDNLATGPAPYVPVLAHDNYHDLAGVVAASNAYCLFATSFLTPDLVDIPLSEDQPDAVMMVLVEHEGRARSTAAHDIVSRLTDILTRAASSVAGGDTAKSDM